MTGVGDADARAPRLRRALARARSAAAGRVVVEAFSRGDAVDPDWMGWGALRVLSRQEWSPGAAHDDGRVANMERLLLVLDGALDADCGDLGRHRVEAGGALWIGTGHGLESRLSNASAIDGLRLVELWLQPDRVNAAPAVAAWPAAGRPDRDGRRGADGWQAVAGGEADANANTDTDPDPLPMRQRGAVMLADIGPGGPLDIPEGDGRYWLEVLDGGTVAIAARSPADASAPRDGPHLAEGDGIAWLAGAPGAPTAVAATGEGPARVLLLVLPA